MPGKQRAHYTGDYQARSDAVRDAANRNPDTRCWRCGQPARDGDPWQSGHIIDGQVGGRLAAEHRSCNARAGGQLRHRTHPPEPRTPW